MHHLPKIYFFGDGFPTFFSPSHRTLKRASTLGAVCFSSALRPESMDTIPPTLQETIKNAYQKSTEIQGGIIDTQVKEAILTTIALLDQGRLRIAEKTARGWIVHTWLKQAILLYFRMAPNKLIDAAHTRYFDKIPLKYATFNQQQFQKHATRVVPNACIRYGAYIAQNVTLMPCFVNIGAYVGTGSMVDTWATVGSCAQIGENVHLSGGVGIGGVLEPLQDKPTVIEDNCFIGARSEIVEGVIVEKNSVIGMGVFIGKNTPIYDPQADKTYYGVVPTGSLVLAGSRPFKTGDCQINCAIIVKKADEKTRLKVAINPLLRN